MRARVYRNISRRQEWCGVEPGDALILGTVGWVLLTFFRDTFLLDVLALVLCYAALRLVKRGKPPGTITATLRYALRRQSVLSAAEPDHVGRARPFRPTVAPSLGATNSPGGLLPLLGATFRRRKTARHHE